MSRLRAILVAAALLWTVAAASARPPAPSASIESAAWLAGRWVGEGLGGQVEETWSPAQGGQMVGHFALRRNGAPAFYELMLLDVQPGGLRLRVKHFNPDFTGWEERDGWHSFEPRAAGPNSLRFDGLWLRLEGEELVATVTIGDRATGATREHQLRLRRAPL